MECPSCCGEGCSHCDDGYFQIKQCPREFIGYEFIEAINLACMNDLLPVAGGLMDQTPWFLQLKRVFASDCSQIQNERTESNV